MMEKGELNNASRVLNEAKKALLDKDSFKLKELSNQTVHSATSYQDPGSTTAAIIIYTLSKLIERQDYENIKDWDKFVKKFNSILNLAILALDQGNQEAYSNYMLKARKALESISNLKQYIKEVIRKAAINKGGKLYEHGISLEQTARLLGVSQWELSEYAAQRLPPEISLINTLDIKKRAKMALEFFA